MNLKRYFRKEIVKRLEQRGIVRINRRVLNDWLISPPPLPSMRGSLLPVDASMYLVPGNPRLVELQERYSTFDTAVTAPLDWTEDHVSPDDMLYFRRDNAYLWQLRSDRTNFLAYMLATYYVESIDTLGLLDKSKEDTYFGNICFDIDSHRVSRDLLDSILEIYFLEKHLKLSSSENLTLLDIGAGYGRLAHRMLTGLRNIKRYLCTDAYPVSTFISEYYLRFRNLGDRARVVPLDEIEQALNENPVDIAINIHSFPECQLSAIEWWLSLLSRHAVRYLMIVPNSDRLITNDNHDFCPIVERNGYRLVASDPKYQDPVLRAYGLYPASYFLFELT